MNSGSLANLKEEKYTQLKKRFGSLTKSQYLFIDIYDLLVTDSMNYYLDFGLTGTEAKILSVFIVQTYGNHEDFTNYLIVNNDRFNLKRNSFLSIYISYGS